MKLLAIDPGGACGAVLLDTATSPPAVLEVWTATTLSPLLSMVYGKQCDAVVVEDIVKYHGPIGQTTIATIKLIGRIQEACRRARVKCDVISRPDVCRAIAGKTMPKAYINQAVRDMYPQSGGGKHPANGTKAQPGPLYGVAKHSWDALALGVVWCKTAPR